MSSSLTYKDAGVDIEAGNTLVNNIKKSVARTNRPGVLSPIGGFGGLFEIPVNRFKNPVMVSCTDGVGTKLMLAIQLDKHDTIGIDCVAMCANDCVVSGAEPLWFLDYYATGKLSVEVAQSVIEGIAKGCEQTGMALIGGETAEMPGMYKEDDYDVAGFCVGIVEKDKILDGKNIVRGDVLVGLPSSGVHSNGFSLIRKIIEQTNTTYDELFDESTLGETLLTPTKLYVQQTLKLLPDNLIKAAAHITGGGLIENIPRVLPDDLMGVVNLDAWRMPPIFNWLQQMGNLSQNEMLTTFNCGIGMVYVVAPEHVDVTLACLESCGERPVILGSVDDKQNNDMLFEGNLV